MPAKRVHQLKITPAWSKEFKDLVNGVSGGFLFGIPLLYTMEVWFIGSEVQPSVLIYILSTTYIIIFFLIRVQGARRNSSHKIIEAVTESIEAMAIGTVCAALMLVLLQQITRETSVNEGLGKIIFEGVPFSLGVALSKSILSGERALSGASNFSPAKQVQQKRRTAGKTIWQYTLADLSATAIGAVFIAFAIAPTDEVAMLAAAASPPWILAIMAASLIVSYTIVFAAGFTNQKKRYQQQGLFQRPWGETVFSYLVSLLASVLMLWFFRQLSVEDPWSLWLSYTVILGLPSTIGGAAGRIAI
ncbi:MAG: TIGR02587 family membrane protein [Waterburya sp.]